MTNHVSKSDESLTIEQVDRNQFYQLTDALELVYGRRLRPELMETPSGDIAKCLWQRKQHQHLSPAERFVMNADALAGLAISAPKVSRLLHCPDLTVHLLYYKKLPGVDLRSQSQAGDQPNMNTLAKFLSELHQKGVYFRAIHLGNILETQDGPLPNYALIDISDLTIRHQPLSAFLRARNLTHLFTVSEDRDSLTSERKKQLLQTYFQDSGLSNFAENFIRFWIKVHGG